MARVARPPRPLRKALFTSAPSRLEAGPADHFEVGKAYLLPFASFNRWVDLGRAVPAPDDMRAENEPASAPVAAPATQAFVKPPADTKVEPAQVDLEEAIAAAPAPKTMRHAGAGKYHVYDADNVRLTDKPVTKAEAEAMVGAPL